jgi:hypothetical protein
VCDQETSKNEEAKARYWAVKIQPQWIVTPGKQQQQQQQQLFTSISQFRMKNLMAFGETLP